MTLLFLLTVATALQWTRAAETCPAAYKRFSSKHSFCKPTNPTCNVLTSGVKDRNEIDLILGIHNRFRSKIATGKQEGLPPASGMLQMEWDKELSAVALKWAMQCLYEHDCHDCRSVENFGVGQNIAFIDWSCPTEEDCLFDSDPMKPDWSKVLGMFYDEVKDVDHSLMASMKFPSGKVIGHFTQMVWEKSWRVGCGYVIFKYDYTFRQLYVCNYGPSGNIFTQPVYEAGTSCKHCPINSCCGNKCEKTENTFPGLCKMLDVNVGPVYKQTETGLIFNCDFSKEKKDCQAIYNQKWKIHQTLSGHVASVKLNGGETTKMDFETPITPSTGDFCLVFRFRKGPAVDGKADSSNLVVLLKPERRLSMKIEMNMSGKMFSPYSLTLTGMTKTRFALSFSVPADAPAQILDIKNVFATNGICK